MDDNNSFLSNYNSDGVDGEQRRPVAKSYTFEQKSRFKRPERKNGPLPQQDDKKKKLLTGIIAGGGALVLLIVLLVVLVGRGPEVLDFTGRKLTDAQLWANENGVNLTTEEAFSDTVEEGYIIEQDVPAGSRVGKGSFISVTVSLGPDLSVTLPLPDLMSMTADEVRTWAESNHMTKVRITTEYSADIPSGRVIRYEINDNTVVDEVRRDTPVYVIVSKGPEEAAATVKVPDFKTKSMAECYQWATESGVMLDVEEQFDDYVPAGIIISQSVKPDQMISVGTEIKLVVSKGAMVIVPDFSDYTKEQAMSLASEIGLPVSITERYSSTSEGRLRSQSIEPGSVYESGQLLELTYSLGNKIVVPSFVGQTADAVETWAQGLNANGAKITIETSEAYSNQQRGTVIYQDPVNQLISYRSTVAVTVSAGRLVYVPDLTGPGDSNYNNAITREKAIAMCEENGLIPNFIEDDTGGKLPGEIWKQSPAPGTEATEGTKVTLWFKPAKTTVTVENFIGMTYEQAAAYLDRLDIVFVDNGGDTVTGQSLPAGSTVTAGSVITLTLGETP